MKLLLLFCSLINKPDPDTNYLNLIHKKIIEVQKDAPIYYTDQLDTGTQAWILKAFNKKKIMNITTSTSIKSIRFSGPEIRAIRSQIQNWRSKTWPNELFPSSRSVQNDSIREILRQANQLIIDSLRKLSKYDANHYFIDHSLSMMITFSPPLYLRNKSIPISFFRWFNSRGGGGSETLWIYKQINGDWKRQILVLAGDW